MDSDKMPDLEEVPPPAEEVPTKRRSGRITRPTIKREGEEEKSPVPEKIRKKPGPKPKPKVVQEATEKIVRVKKEKIVKAKKEVKKRKPKKETPDGKPYYRRHPAAKLDQRRKDAKIDEVSDIDPNVVHFHTPGVISNSYMTCDICSSRKYYTTVYRKHGMFSCSGCQYFWFRHMQQPQIYNCPNLGKCNLLDEPICLACRVLKCLEVYNLEKSERLDGVIEKAPRKNGVPCAIPPLASCRSGSVNDPKDDQASEGKSPKASSDEDESSSSAESSDSEDEEEETKEQQAADAPHTTSEESSDGDEQQESEVVHMSSVAKVVADDTSTDTSYSKPRKPPVVLPMVRKNEEVSCAICSISRYYETINRQYGEFSCYACNKFWTKFVEDPKRYRCDADENCLEMGLARKHCEACRAKKCFDIYTHSDELKERLAPFFQRVPYRPVVPQITKDSEGESQDVPNAVTSPPVTQEIAQPQSTPTKEVLVTARKSPPKPVLKTPTKTSTPSPKKIGSPRHSDPGPSTKAGHSTITCPVCEGQFTYTNLQRRYGRFACVPCYRFAKDFLKTPQRYVCNGNSDCSLNTGHKDRCKACWIQRCETEFEFKDESATNLLNHFRPVARKQAESVAPWIKDAPDVIPVIPPRPPTVWHMPSHKKKTSRKRSPSVSPDPSSDEEEKEVKEDTTPKVSSRGRTLSKPNRLSITPVNKRKKKEEPVIPPPIDKLLAAKKIAALNAKLRGNVALPADDDEAADKTAVVKKETVAPVEVAAATVAASPVKKEVTDEPKLPVAKKSPPKNPKVSHKKKKKGKHPRNIYEAINKLTNMSPKRLGNLLEKVKDRIREQEPEKVTVVESTSSKTSQEHKSCDVCSTRKSLTVRVSESNGCIMCQSCRLLIIRFKSNPTIRLCSNNLKCDAGNILNCLACRIKKWTEICEPSALEGLDKQYFPKAVESAQTVPQTPTQIPQMSNGNTPTSSASLPTPLQTPEKLAAATLSNMRNNVKNVISNATAKVQSTASNVQKEPLVCATCKSDDPNADVQMRRGQLTCQYCEATFSIFSKINDPKVKCSKSDTNEECEMPEGNKCEACIFKSSLAMRSEELDSLID